MHWYTCILSMLWRIHIIFPSLTELCPLIHFRIMFMLNIWYRYIGIFMPKHAQQQQKKKKKKKKKATLAGYQVVLVTLLFKFRYFENYKRNLDRHTESNKTVLLALQKGNSCCTCFLRISRFTKMWKHFFFQKQNSSVCLRDISWKHHRNQGIEMVSIIISNRLRATQTFRNHNQFASSRNNQICTFVKCHWCSVYMLVLFLLIQVGQEVGEGPGEGGGGRDTLVVVTDCEDSEAGCTVRVPLHTNGATV